MFQFRKIITICLFIISSFLVTDSYSYCLDKEIQEYSSTYLDGLHMIHVPSGSFTMGSSASEPGRDPDEDEHQVILTKGFYIGIYEITQQVYEFVMGDNPSFFKYGLNYPVERVSWFEAIEFCNKLSELLGFEKAYEIDGQIVTWNENADGYRLPTESEWEYACRAQTKTAFYNGPFEYFGENPYLDKIGWYYYNSILITHASGEKIPNNWGLYDMSGNVWEWCWDWFGKYPPSAVTDPTGPESGKYRVTRGGSWSDYANNCRSAERNKCFPDHFYSIMGFRLARTANYITPTY